MAATLELDERNGASPGTLTANVPAARRYNYGRVDTPSIVPSDTTLVVIPASGSAFSYEKWQRIRVVSMDTSVLLDNLRFWHAVGALVTGESFVTNLEAGTPHNDAYATPVNTASAVAVRALAGPGAEPASANLYRGTDDFFDTAAQSSNYIVWQAVIASTSPPGNVNQKTFRLHYDEQ